MADFRSGKVEFAISVRDCLRNNAYCAIPVGQLDLRDSGNSPQPHVLVGLFRKKNVMSLV